MNAVTSDPLLEIFSRILHKLGKMGDFYSLANELSQDNLGAYVRLFRWLLTQPNYANLKQRIVNQQFFLLVTQLANLDQQHEDAGLPAATAPSIQLQHLLEDPQLFALQPRLEEKSELRELLFKLSKNEASPLVEKLANDGVYHVAEKLSAMPDDDPLIERLADDTTPFFDILQLLSAHPEVDGLLAAILRQLASNPNDHILPEDENFAQLVIDLAESQAVMDPARSIEFYDLARGFASEVESQVLARKILFNARFPQVAARLADDPELTKVVRRMLDDERHKKVAEMLMSNDTARLMFALAEKAGYRETIKRLETDEGFAELVNELRKNAEFFEQVKQLSKDEVLKGLEGALTQRPLIATSVAKQLCSLGESLQEQGNADDAISTYMLAIRMDGDLREAYLGHAQACESKGYFTQCVEDYRTLVEKNSQDSKAHLKLGQIYLHMNMLDEAEQRFRRVLKLSSDNDERQQADEGLGAVARMV